MQKLLFTTVVLVLSISALGQTLDTAWVNRYNGPMNSDDMANAIAVDTAGFIVAAGASTGEGTGLDFMTIKYSALGDTVWARSYNGPGNARDVATAIAVDRAGCVYVTGESAGDGTRQDFVTIKYFPNGNTAWVRRYDAGALGDVPNAIGLDTLGNVFVVGYCDASTPLKYDYVTIKYDSVGTETWVQRFHEFGDEVATALFVTPSGDSYVTGRAQFGTTYDIVTIKYEPTGDTLWARRYHGPSRRGDEGRALAVDDSANLIVAGYCTDNSGNRDYVIVKYGPDGDTAWVRKYIGPAGTRNDKPIAVRVDRQGNIFVTGDMKGADNAVYYGTLEYSAAGEMLWQHLYGVSGEGDSHPYALAVDDSGSVYVTGTSHDAVSGYDIATVKYLSSGAQSWALRYESPALTSAQGSAIVVNGPTDVWVAGASQGTGTALDFMVIKYGQSIALGADDTETPSLPEAFALAQNYPNPFNPNTRMQFSLPRPSYVTLDITNVLGQRVSTLLSQWLPAGVREVDWSGRDSQGNALSSGVYFYSLKTEYGTATRKLVLLK